jgi:lysozyme
MKMKTSLPGLNLIKEHEALRLNAYLCPAQVWTIGYGHTRTAKQGMKISIEQADALLREDLAWAEKEVNDIGVQLTQNQFDALVSLVFNIGGTLFRQSTARRLVAANPGDVAIGPAIRLFIKANGAVLPGLVSRRKHESELYYK